MLHLLCWQSRALLGLVGAMVLGAALPGAAPARLPRENPVTRLDLPKIAKEVQTQGMAGYVPVAYRTMGVATEDWAPLDPTARAHFVLYMAHDCSHFVLKWEMPALVRINDSQPTQKASVKEYEGVSSRPGPGPKVVQFRDQKRNLLLNSYSIGRMARLYTRGPFNAMADAVHEHPAAAAAGAAAGGTDQWGAIIHCSLHFGNDAAGMATPLAIYETNTDGNGEPLSGGAILEVPEQFVEPIQRMLKNTTTQAKPSPLYWCVTANMFNLTLLKERADIREMKAELDKVGEYISVITKIAGAYEKAAAEPEFWIIETATLEETVPLDVVEVLFELEKAAYVAIFDKMDKRLADLVDVRVLCMFRPEPMAVAPWTFTYLDGKTKGTDTWDAVELRGGYVDTGKYTWACGAGACFEWAARLTVRPSMLVLPFISTPLPVDELIVGPQEMHFQVKRSDNNWENLDRCLVEHHNGAVNAPMLLFASNPLVNYEIFDQEVLKATGTEVAANSPAVSRKQLFWSMSLCGGADTVYGRNKRVDFEAAHQDAVSVRTESLDVTVTFVHGAMPQGAVVVQKGDVQPIRGRILESMGLEVKAFNPADYEDKWWYEIMTGEPLTTAGLLAKLHKAREGNGLSFQVPEIMTPQHLAAQKKYLSGQYKELLERRRTQAQEQRQNWQETLGEPFTIAGGSLVFNPKAGRFASNMQFKDMRLAYVPAFEPITLKEPINWYRLVVDRETTGLPDLEAAAPRIEIEGDRMVVHYKPAKGPAKSTIHKMPAGAADLERPK